MRRFPSIQPSRRPLVNKWLLGAFKGRLSAVKSCAFILCRESDTSQGVYHRYLTCKVNVKCCRQRRRSDRPSNGEIVSVFFLVLFCCFTGSKTFKTSFFHPFFFPSLHHVTDAVVNYRSTQCPLPPSWPLPPNPPHTHTTPRVLEIVLLILPPTPRLSAFLTPPPSISPSACSSHTPPPHRTSLEV